MSKTHQKTMFDKKECVPYLPYASLGLKNGVELSIILKTFNGYILESYRKNKEFNLDNFFSYFLDVKFKKTSFRSSDTLISYLVSDKYFNRDYSLNENHEDCLNKFIDKSFLNIKSLTKDIFNFYCFDKDRYYYFKSYSDLYKKRNLYIHDFIVNVLRPIMNKELFKESFLKHFNHKLSYYVNAKTAKPVFLETKEIYLVQEKIPFELILKNGLPKIQTLKLKKSNYVVTDDCSELQHIFAVNPNDDYNRKELTIIQYPQYNSFESFSDSNFISERNDYLVFFDKETAQDYHRSNLIDLKKKIDSVLEEDVIF